MDPTSPDDLTATKLVRIGWGLLILGFTLPILAAALGADSRTEFGFLLFVAPIGSMTVAGITSWAVSGSSARSDARRRLITGGSLAFCALIAAGWGWQRAAARRLWERETEELQALITARGHYFPTRISADELRMAMNADGITSTRGIAKARAVVAGARESLDERRTMVTASSDAWRALLDTSSAGAEIRTAVADSLVPALDAAIRLNDRLEIAQRNVLDTMCELLDWASAQHGTLTARGSHLVFADDRQRAQYQRLAAKFVAAEARQQQVVQEGASTGTTPSRSDSAYLDHLLR